MTWGFALCVCVCAREDALVAKDLLEARERQAWGERQFDPSLATPAVSKFLFLKGRNWGPH